MDKSHTEICHNLGTSETHSPLYPWLAVLNTHFEEIMPPTKTITE